MGRTTVGGIATIIALLLLGGTASAQLCGDPDGSGAVTEADGVIALQAAAELGTSCSLATCDVDGSGSIDDTDAVLVFRKAVDLPAVDNCPSGGVGGPGDARVNVLVERVLPFLEEPFGSVPQIAGFPTPAEDDEILVDCDNVGEGEFLITADDFSTVVSFFDCLRGDTEFDGDLEDADDGFFVFLTATVALNDLDEDEITYEGEGLSVTDTGSGLRVSGTFEASTFFESPPLIDAGDFVLDTSVLEVTPDGVILGGTATLDLAETELTNLTAIELAFDGSNVAQVTVTGGVQGPQTFGYNLTTRQFL